MNSVQIEDFQLLSSLESIDWERFKGSSFLITGSTGLIGSNLVYALAYISQTRGLGINLLLPVRNVVLAKELFDWTGAEIVPYEIGSEIHFANTVDYIVHLASPTSSAFFTQSPVDTMLVNIEGTKALLEWAVKNTVRKFVYLSSMEVYGSHPKGTKITEEQLGCFETMNPRNSYPIAKIACESLCNGYYVQYGVPAVVLRATQTFGPGVKYDDGRVFAQFMRCALEKKDIVLKSLGLTERPYLYTADAVSAILISLLKATPGEAYTVANPDTYCSIIEMAQMVANDIASGKINVVFDVVEDIEKLGYAETLYMDLGIEKIKSLGWEPTVSLKEMFRRMMLYFE